MRFSARARSSLPMTLAVVAVLACGGDSPTAPPLVAPAISAATGDGATATVASAPTQAPSVVVTDSHGQRRSGIVVTFTPDSISGTVANTTATTDAAGIASAGTWTFGTRAGPQRITVTGTVDGKALSTTLSATATADRPASITVVSGGAQDGPFGASLVTPMVVKVTDRYGNANAGVAVHFSIDSGSVIGGATPTTTTGTTTVRVRLPLTTGPAVLTASADSVPSVQSTFTSRGIRFASFALYQSTACGLSTEGYPYCWGTNASGELVPLGIPAAQTQVTTPQPITGDYDFTAISLENFGGCALDATGAATCWGSNIYGANGNGGVSLTNEPMKPVTGNLKFVEIHRGPSVTCGTTKSGQSYCWGVDGVGQSGAGTNYSSSSPNPVPIDGGITFHSYAMGLLHTCALDPNGKAYCWGMNTDGRIGVATAPHPCSYTVYNGSTPTVYQTSCAPSPVAVNTSVTFTALAAVRGATCGLTGAGDVYCWGNNALGALATGDTVSTSIPTKVATLPALKELHGGGQVFCGLTASGDIYCWGMGIAALGAPDGTCGAMTDCHTTPVKLPTTRQFSTIAMTAGDVCGLSSGVAYCWGGNYNGALGIGTAGGSASAVTTPTALAGQTP